MKYLLKVVTIPEKKDAEDKFSNVMFRPDKFENAIFQAEMTPDNTIEILQHLYDLDKIKLVN